MAAPGTYSVGQISKLLDIPASTLRYYEQQGLLRHVQRTDGGQRQYCESDFQLLRVIECLKASGLSIDEIRAFIEMAERGDESIGERLALFENRRQAVLRQMEDLKQTLAVLEYKCWYYTTAKELGGEEAVAALPDSALTPKLRRTRKRLQSVLPAK